MYFYTTALGVCSLASFLCFYLALKLLNQSVLLFGTCQFFLSSVQPLPSSSRVVHLLLPFMLLYFVQDLFLLLSLLMLFLIMFNVQVDQLKLLQYSLYLWMFAPLEMLFPPFLSTLEVPFWMSNLMVELEVELLVLAVCYPWWILLPQ